MGKHCQSFGVEIDVIEFSLPGVTMPGHCAVKDCSNGSYQLARWRQVVCDMHGCNYGTARCICPAPFQLFPFPTLLRNPDGRQRWKEAVNRADAKQPWKYMDPSKDQRVCSEHFIDGEPTGQHPDPELHLGYELPGSKIKTENIQRIPIDQEHFEPDQFESHRADGKRKLTPCAVPTLFCHLEKAKRRTLPARTLPARTKSSKPTASEHAYCARSRKKVLLRQTDEIDSDSNIFAKQNSDSMDAMKDAACSNIDDHSEALSELSHDIWSHPETFYQEKHAHDVLTSFLETRGFTVDKHFVLETAFRARYGSGSPHVAVLCEYDALPKIGHACGHNLIAEVGVAAGLGLLAALRCPDAGNTQGTVTVLGTPAEEEGSGKIDMLRAGVFKDVDVALMAHPGWCSAIHMHALAIHTLTIKYFGKASHAAADPWNGINALDAAVLCYTNISCLRQQLKPSWRIHGVITNGGAAPNVIPEVAELSYYVRTPTMSEMETAKARIGACVEAAAHATGCTVEYSFDDKPMANLITNRTLSHLYRQNAARVDVPLLDDSDPRLVAPSGSTDMGNVSHAVPSLHTHFYIGTDARAHTRPFAQAADSREAQPHTLSTAKIIALTAIDVIGRPELLKQIKREFKEDISEED